MGNKMGFPNNENELQYTHSYPGRYYYNASLQLQQAIQ